MTRRSSRRRPSPLRCAPAAVAAAPPAATCCLQSPVLCAAHVCVCACVALPVVGIGIRRSARSVIAPRRPAASRARTRLCLSYPCLLARSWRTLTCHTLSLSLSLTRDCLLPCTRSHVIVTTATVGHPLNRAIGNTSARRTCPMSCSCTRCLTWRATSRCRAAPTRGCRPSSPARTRSSLAAPRAPRTRGSARTPSAAAGASSPTRSSRGRSCARWTRRRTSTGTCSASRRRTRATRSGPPRRRRGKRASRTSGTRCARPAATGRWCSCASATRRASRTTWCAGWAACRGCTTRASRRCSSRARRTTPTSPSTPACTPAWSGSTPPCRRSCTARSSAPRTRSSAARCRR